MPAAPPDEQPDAPNGAAVAAPVSPAAAAAAPAPLKLDADAKPLGSVELDHTGSPRSAEEAARRRVTLRVDVSAGTRHCPVCVCLFPGRFPGPPAALFSSAARECPASGPCCLLTHAAACQRRAGMPAHSLHRQARSSERACRAMARVQSRTTNQPALCPSSPSSPTSRWPPSGRPPLELRSAPDCSTLAL